VSCRSRRPASRARRPTEVVDRDRVDAALGEAEGKLFVEAIEPPNVREADDADPVGLVGGRLEGCEAVAVGRLELDVVVRDRSAGNSGDRRQRVEVEAHGTQSIGGVSSCQVTANEPPSGPTAPGIAFAPA
jgi:hypothetical protein